MQDNSQTGRETKRIFQDREGGTAEFYEGHKRNRNEVKWSSWS